MHYSKSLIALSGVTLFLTGCAGQVADNTPVVDTSILNVNMHIGGVLLPEVTTKQTRYTVADKSVVKSEVEYDSWIVNKMLGGGNQALITRLDKNLIWDVNFDLENYQECPLTGCTSLNPFEKLEQLGEDDSEEAEVDYDPNGTDSCEVTVKKYDFTVTPKARQRDVNGFMADQYVARWDLVSEDEYGKQDSHVVTMDYWMANTASNQALKAAHAFDKKYYDTAIAPTPLAQLANENIAEIMTIFSAGKEKELKKLTSVGGEPISVKMEWYADINTCQEPAKAEQEQGAGFDANDPLGSLQGMATGFLSKQAEKGVKSWMGLKEGEPVLTYLREVKSAQMSGEHTSRFEVPDGFKLIDRK